MKTANDFAKVLETNLEKAKFQLKMTEGILQSHNTICVYPDTLLTITYNSTKDKLIISSQIIASQWTVEAAKQICSNVTNGRGEHPIMMGVRDYYTKQVSHIEQMILQRF